MEVIRYESEPEAGLLGGSGVLDQLQGAVLLR
jgi:hypothetical protein